MGVMTSRYAIPFQSTPPCYARAQPASMHEYSTSKRNKFTVHTLVLEVPCRRFLSRLFCPQFLSEGHARIAIPSEARGWCGFIYLTRGTDHDLDRSDHSDPLLG